MALRTEGTDTPAGKLGSRVSCRVGSEVETLGPDDTVVIGMISGPNEALEVSVRPAFDGAFAAASVDCAAETEPFRFLATCSSSESSEGVRSIVSAAEPPPKSPEAAVRRRGRPGAASAALVADEELLELYEEVDTVREVVAAAVLGRNGFDDGLRAFARPC